MASARFRMIGVALFVVALSAFEAYRWDGDPKDKAKIRACVGGSASFPWHIAMGLGETLLGRDWWFQEPDKEKTQIATYDRNHFYATAIVRAGFVPNAGLSIRYARPQDSGNYSVQVKFKQADSSLASVWRTVTLSVKDRPPSTQDGALHVTLSDAVRDDVTKDWTLQLHCGQFDDLGHPPVHVVWKTPSGEVRDSSYEVNGTFVLSVSRLVQGGNYSCRLPPSAPAARCLTATSPLNAAAQLYVDDKDVRLSFLEAHQMELEEANEDQANLLQHQAMQISQQKETMVQVTKDQANLLQHQNGLIGEMKADQLNLTTQLSALAKTVNDLRRQIYPANCVDWLTLDPRSGVRTVYVSREPINVYCDQTTDNGGWLVFQRRQDASVDFYRNWAEYRNGFGDLEGNFWLGLDKLHKLTTSQRYELRVDLHKWNGTKGYATFRGFYVEDASRNFTLRVDNFTGGNAGDSLTGHRGQQFTTKDRDNDVHPANCAVWYRGAWWYTACYGSSLNSRYKTRSQAKGGGVAWGRWGGGVSMKYADMKIRPI